MRRALVLLLASMIVMLAAGASDKKQRPVKPRPAIGDYTSTNYPLTFRAPAGAFTCPLMPGWEGSDHGTVVFLTPPKMCYGAGFPSSNRGFEPGDVPRIDVYYGYDVGEDASKPPPCRDGGTATLFGKPVKLCRGTDGGTDGGMATITAKGFYTTDMSVELGVTLVATPGDIERYMPTLKALLMTMHSCTAMWEEDAPHGKKKLVPFGHGPRCPAGEWY